MLKKINIENKQARFNYEWLETFVAGIQLMGTEIKSLRNGKANIVESFCQIKNGELFIINMQIEEYAQGNIWNHSPKRTRKLLLQKKELKKLEKSTSNSSLTIVPTSLFINEKGIAKVRVVLARGRKTHDKRHLIKEKDLAREMKRIVKNH